MTDLFHPPSNIVGLLRTLGASQREIDTLRATYSEDAIKKALRVVEGDSDIPYKVPYLFRVLKEKVPQTATVTPIKEQPLGAVMSPEQRESNSKTMLDLSMASVAKIARIRELLKANIKDEKVFPLPEVTRDKMLKEIDNDNNLINPRVVLCVRMLLKHLGKRFEEDF